jgi:hypothetical protein
MAAVADPTISADELLDNTARAARSKINHLVRAQAAEQQRNEGFVKLHTLLGWSYGKIERELRTELMKAGLSDREIDQCGITNHNVRSAIRKTRPKK